MGKGFHLIPAHSVTALAEALAAQIASRENPLVPETVLVMNYAQRVWLQRFLAEKLGICANLRFVSPESFLQELVSAETDSRVFERESLAWRIFETLKKTHAPAAGLPEALRFFTEEKSEEDIFLLAGKLGDLFWRYQSFRPQMIRRWTENAPAPKNADADFLLEYARQKKLWQALDFGNATPPAVAWINQLARPLPPEKTPSRIFAFAPSALPRLHAELLEKLSESAEVFLYYHHLSSNLWTESANRKTELRERLRRQKKSAGTPGNTTEAEPSAESPFAPIRGNELLASWGKAARPLAEHLIDAGYLDSDPLDSPPDRDSLLHALQREIRDDAEIPTAFTPAEEDSSLRISVAPNRIREMEILRDALIARFAEDPTLRPRDVLVMFPNIADYTPFIRTAFENSGIPFTVADRAGTELFPVAAAFLEILRVASGEFRLEDILSLLDRESISAALGSDEAESSALRRVLSEAGVRWGSKVDFRKSLIFGDTVPAESMAESAERFAANNSWEFGLRRLALGCMCGDGAAEMPLEASDGILPVEQLSESAPVTFGKIVRLLRLLEMLNRNFSQKEIRPVPEWCDFLKTHIADGLLDLGNGNAEILRSVLNSVKTAAQNACGNNVPASCSLSALRVALNRCDWSPHNTGTGMLRGKITFCQMQPMRNIPAKVICLAGLNDGAFPHASDRNATDLLSFPAKNFPGDPVRWDRSRRDDDCLLFLESILAAQNTLLLSYVGRNAEDGQPVPPCVPLAKLRRFLLQMTAATQQGTTGTEDFASAFETEHRLHGFSPEYFSAPSRKHGAFLSFNRADYATLRGKLSAEKEDDGPSAEMPQTDFERPPEISVEELVSFFKSPAQYLCRNIFGVSRDINASAVKNDDPPAECDGLDTSRFHTSVLEKTVAYLLGEDKTPPDLDTECRRFRERLLAEGKISALAEPDKFENKLKETIKYYKDLSAFAFFRKRYVRVPATDVPAFVDFRADDGNAEKQADLRVNLNFENLLCDEDGALFLPLFNRKEFCWKGSAEIFVYAQMLAEAFPRRNFSVYYFAYDEKTPKFITRESLESCGMSSRELLALYVGKLFAPPVIFENIPLRGVLKESEDDFVADVKDAWSGKKYSPEEVFVFGEDAAETRADELRKITFPLLQNVFKAIREDDAADTKSQKKGKKKPKNIA